MKSAVSQREISGTTSERLNVKSRFSPEKNQLSDEDPPIQKEMIDRRRESKGWKQIGKMPTNAEVSLILKMNKINEF